MEEKNNTLSDEDLGMVSGGAGENAAGGSGLPTGKFYCWDCGSSWQPYNGPYTICNCGSSNVHTTPKPAEEKTVTTIQR